MSQAAERLREVHTFPQLVKYLRDRLDWPIEQYDFDELTFEYSADELGIDAGNAAKVEYIKQLRPLSSTQPWGIFFVKFAPSRLPVTALRRILNEMVIKKRATARVAERQTWQVGDLLFISSYGGDEDRQISLAHFSQQEGRDDLPTLKVLGWDNLDTPLHLDDVADKLEHKLAWPDHPEDVATWRDSWASAFTLRPREVITTSKELSIRLAELARAIRDRIKTALAIETDRGPLTKLMKAFQEALVHDLDADGFADMYAQTITYGLLSARIADPRKKTADDFAGHMRTNPFLHELMETFLKLGGRRGKAGGPGIDYDELGVSEVVELLDDANMEAVVLDFGDRNPQEDPVIHFYELFLKEYDAKKRMQRGVFYTPRPVVSYIVRSVDELLRAEFGLTDGLADTATWGEMATRHKDLKIPDGVSPDQDFVQILDPATGTGTFLVEVIDLIHKTLVAKWQAQRHGEKKIAALWNEYVPKHLLQRLHGYELLMAPYAIAHLKIGLKLYETGYRFGSDERARVYLTNSLEPPSDLRQQVLTGLLPALAHEAQAVNQVKAERRFTVLIGNPPYAGNSSNRGAWIEGLIGKYRWVDGQPLGEVKVWLKDDYVKFVRFGQWILEMTGAGVLGYITNNSFFDGLTFRGMRQHLLLSSAQGYFLNLHGNGNLKEHAPDGSLDENVFDILQGVGVTLLVRGNRDRGAAPAFAADLYGVRDAKYAELSRGHPSLTDFSSIQSKSPNYFVVVKSGVGEEEYGLFPPLSSLFEIGGLGFQSHRDGFVVALSREELLDRMRAFFDLKHSDKEVKERFGVDDYRRFVVREFRRKNKFDEENVRRVQYRPFDYRYMYYAKDIVQEWQIRFHGHLLRPNIGLNVMRQTKSPEWQHVMVSRTPTPAVFVEIKDGSSQFPLYRYGDHDDSLFAVVGTRVPNLDERTVAAWLKGCGGRPSWSSQSGTRLVGVGPEEICAYIYAVLHSPTYRTRYGEFLKIEFPRVPPAGSIEVFHRLVRLGHELIALHLLEAPKLDKIVTNYTGPKNPKVTRIGWSDGTVWLDAAGRAKGRPVANGSAGFHGVSEGVWNFHIGGYQVCEKWLKDRKGRTLSTDDITHYQRIVVALSETIRIMEVIDEVIEEHGGWPGAFTKHESSVGVKEAPLRKVAEPPAKPYRGKKSL